MVRTTSYDQAEILQNILKLHVPDGVIDCDPCYSKGNFYENTGITAPRYRFDIEPQSEDVVFADCRNLPLADNSLNCIMFDPPFLATTGKSLYSNEGNVITRRFGVYPTEKELHQFYADSMREFYRILRKNGILIVKCQDKVSSGLQYMSHVFMMNQAVELGFYPKDLFILLSENRIYAKWQTENQRHARKYHCYYWVFQKNSTVVHYL